MFPLKVLLFYFLWKSIIILLPHLLEMWKFTTSAEKKKICMQAAFHKLHKYK